jgi:hypothetical protein
MIQSILDRQKRMQDIVDRGFQSVSPLVAFKNLADVPEYQNFKRATLVYLNSYFPNRYVDDIETMIKIYSDEYDSISFITPSGAVVPKTESGIEFNSLVKAYYELVNSLNISDMISHISRIPNIRFQQPGLLKQKNSSKHGTTLPHTDAWAGEDSASITMHIAIAGDTERNCVRIYDNPKNFEDSWLDPLPSYEHGKVFIPRYEQFAFICPKDHILFYDAATLHESTFLNGCEARLSLDGRFVTHHEIENSRPVTPERMVEQMTMKELSKVGNENIMAFVDSVKDRNYQGGQGKHFANVKLINVKEI